LALDIFDHPVVERLVDGEPILASEMRQAVVDFWKANETFALCANCSWTKYVSGRPEVKRRPRGCCESCPHFIENKGCGQRNLSCLFFTCDRVKKHLKEAGAWESFHYLERLICRLAYRKEPYFNVCRLPPRARLYLADLGEDAADYNLVDGVFIDSDYEGVPRDRLEGA
jgi:hypothetical protein